MRLKKSLPFGSYKLFSILQVLLDTDLISTEEAVRSKVLLLEKYDPFTRCLEEVDICPSAT